MKYVSLLALFAVLAAVPSAEATFLFRGGHYWRGGVAYNRVPCVIRGVPTYRYVVVKNVSKTVNNYPPKNWQVSVVEALAKQQDRSAYLQALGVLRGNVGSAYGGGSYQLNAAGVNGSTIYGYSGLNAAAFYGSADINQLYQALARTTEQAQDLAGTAHTAHADAVGQAANAQAAVAIIIARAQADAAVLQTAKEQVTRTTTYGNTTGAPGVSGAPGLPGSALAIPADDASDALERLVGARCISCHSAANKQGGFDLTKPTITDEEWARVLARINSLDPAKVMPRDATGKPAPLTPAEKELFK